MKKNQNPLLCVLVLSIVVLLGISFIRSPPEIWIMGAFRYEDTVEGEQCWNKVEKEWSIVLHEFCL